MINNLENSKKVLAVSVLCEGNSIRAIERVTGIHRDTIMRLCVRVGEACKKIMDEKMRNLDCLNLEVDEIWGFIGKKNKNATPAERNTGSGDVWTFICIDSDANLIPSQIVGKRDSYHAKAFMEDVAGRMNNRVQISSDALAAYVDAVECSFGANADYGTILKTYSVTNLNKDAASRYSPSEVVKIEKRAVSGNLDLKRNTTSHVEKQNHTLRMHGRRLTRLTNAFSKKLENFEAAVALNSAYYNFCKTHGALRMTPAQAAGIEASAWTVAELVERCANKKEYIERLQMVISQMHGCYSTWMRSDPVTEEFRGQTVWEGDVEVFGVTHSMAKECFAWSDAFGNFTAVLGIPPATDPQNAVRVSIVAEAKKGKK